MFLHYNRIMGGVLLRIRRSETPACPSESDLFDAYSIECVGGLGNEMDPEQFDIWHFGEPEESIWFYAHNDLEVLHLQAQRMEFDHWLSNATSRVEIIIPVYNG